MGKRAMELLLQVDDREDGRLQKGEEMKDG